ncbi:MAG: hypothetical protein ACE5I7_16185 [Candidatus Binatia bacterium]
MPDDVEIIDFGLVRDGPPVMLASSRTDAEGRFDTGDLTAALDASNASIDTNGDGRRTVIAVAAVNDAGAQIGGIVSLQTGGGSRKTFGPTTQVACLAAVFLTAGTTETDPCVVRATCDPNDSACVVTLDPDTLDDDRISRLEAAASVLLGAVVFPDDVGRAACAIITCTNSGAQSTSAECVREAFQAIA